MFQSLLDHHQGDTILVLTSVTKILMWQHVFCIAIAITGQNMTQHTHYNRHAATSVF